MDEENSTITNADIKQELTSIFKAHYPSILANDPDYMTEKQKQMIKDMVVYIRKHFRKKRKQ